MAVIFLLIGLYPFSIFFCLCSIIVFSYFVDIHGFELDTLTFQIRDYRKFLWMRIGNWSNIKNYNSVHLTKGRLVVYPESGEFTPDIYFYFFVKLVDEVNNKEIVLAEFKEFVKAKKLMKEVAETLGIGAKIFYYKTEKI